MSKPAVDGILRGRSAGRDYAPALQRSCGRLRPAPRRQDSGRLRAAQLPRLAANSPVGLPPPLSQRRTSTSSKDHLPKSFTSCAYPAMLLPVEHSRLAAAGTRKGPLAPHPVVRLPNRLSRSRFQRQGMLCATTPWPAPCLRPSSSQQRSSTVCSSSLPRRTLLLSGCCALTLLPPACRAEQSFYERWPSVEVGDLLPFVLATARQGDTDGVLAALDEWALHYPNYSVGAECATTTTQTRADLLTRSRSLRKGAILERLVRAAAPLRALELGSFVGYSAIRTARSMPPAGRLLCVEASSANAAVARALLDYAGVGAKVEILQGLSSALMPQLGARLGAGTGGDGAGGGGGADWVFLDHCKTCYLPDTLALEAAGVIREGTSVVADNVVYPGAPDYLEHVDSSTGRYITRLIEAKFEYDQVWQAGWEVGKKDALSASVRTAAE